MSDVRALAYFLREAAASLWRGRRSAALAIITIAAGLVVLGMVLLAASNLRQVVDRWSGAAELSVYLGEEISPEERAGVDLALAGNPLIAARTHVTKTEALERFRADFPDLAGLAEGFPENPFPASIEVLLAPRMEGGGGEVERLAASLAAMPGVVDVRYDRQWLLRLMTAVALVEGLGLVIVAILVVAAALTVANVVRLAAYMRRDEIEIMELVGAPHAYIKGPFVAEGVLQGGAGALLALAMLWGGFLAAQARYGPAAAELLGAGSLQFLSWPLCLLLLAGGMLVGCAGGLVAARGTRIVVTPVDQAI